MLPITSRAQKRQERDPGREQSWEANRRSYGSIVAIVAQALGLAQTTIRKECEPHGEPTDSGTRSDTVRVALKMDLALQHGVPFADAIAPLEYLAGRLGLGLHVVGGINHPGDDATIIADAVREPAGLVAAFTEAAADGVFDLREREDLRARVPRARQSLRAIEARAEVSPE